MDVPDLSQFKTVDAMLREHAGNRPDAPALDSIEQSRGLTWGELYREANRIAAFLAERGIRANDRITVLGENSIEWLALYFGVLRHGATFCTINVEVNTAHVREMLSRLDPKLVLWHETLDAKTFGEGAPGEWIPFGDLDSATGLFALTRACDPDHAAPSLAGHDDAAVISFTSGTSDTPKGAIHHYGNYFWTAQQTIRMWGITADDRMMEYRSMSWASSHMLCLMPCLVTGACIVFAPRFSQSRFFDWVTSHRPSVIIGVPTVVNMLLERADDIDESAFEGVRFMTCSTAPLMVEQHKRFETRFGIRLIQIYGMSEGGVVAGNHFDDRRIGSVGHPGLYQNVRIVDESGAALPDGEIGQITIGGAQTAFGYLHADGTIEKIRGTRLKTGDLGYIDPNGFLFVTGRAKDVIIRGGVNIAPLEIDNVLIAHPDIAEAATIGVPDQIYGEEVVSYVAARTGSGLDAEAVRAHCAATLPDFKLPREIVFVDDIPKNDRGKIDRNALAERWSREKT